MLVQDKQMSRPWVTLWWELPGNWHSLGFRNSGRKFLTLTHTQSPTVHQKRLCVWSTVGELTASLQQWTYRSTCHRDWEAIINVLNYSPHLMINSVTSPTQPSRAGTHTTSPLGFSRDSFGKGQGMSRLIGFIIFNLLHRNRRSCMHIHINTHFSLAGILTLSGDEVVGSMVALKERRGMTCWVSHLRLRHSCMEGCLYISPFSSPSSLHSALLLTHYMQLWIAFPV